MPSKETTAAGTLSASPGMATVAVEGGEVVIRVQLPTSEPADALVAVAAEPLAALGLEYGPVLRLAQSGELRSVWIGRRRFTKRSWLVALADTLPAATSTPDEPDDLRAAVAKAARRQVRRTTRAAELDA